MVINKLVLHNQSLQMKCLKLLKNGRLGKDVHNKINCLEQQSRATSDLLNQTGAGVTCEEIIKAAVKQRCPHYYQLADVMSNIPSTTTLANMSSINVPDTYENHLEISDAEDKAPKVVDRETSVILDMASTLQKTSQIKRDAEGYRL